MPHYSLKNIVLYFLQLGYSGFGGPVALVGYMHRDLVEKKKWISEEEYKTGLALAQLAPGPLAAQLGIYLGFVHYGIVGATLCGIAFVLPSFLMVVVLGYCYVEYSHLVWMQTVFYGVGAGVIGIITVSSYKLTVKSVGLLTVSSFKKNALLWFFYGLSIIFTILTQREEILFFVLSGFAYMLYKFPPKWSNKLLKHSPLLVSSTWLLPIENSRIVDIILFFAKAGAFVFGSGLAIVPFLHEGVVVQKNWLNEVQFLDAVAVAMITPGPVVITVGFIGYLVEGFWGATAAAFATFLPCYLLTILPAPYFKKISSNLSIKAFVEGITAAVVGALVGSVVVIATRSIVDTPTALIALLSGTSLLYIKKMQEPYIIILAGLAGVVFKLL
ncbi:chromate transporter [Flectobacillus major]|uniref:chromate transporter n=1 Tax=Flectobacillus major TaxID=103 RepID=UPI00040F0EB0|nr:chromate transporter [Flectobacillus major]